MRPRRRWTSPPVGLVDAGGDPQQRRLAGAVRPDQPDPLADRDRGVDRVEDHERADLAGDAREAEERHQACSPAPSPDGRRRPPAGRSPRVAAARRVRSARALRGGPLRPRPGVSPSAPSPASSVQRRPVAAGARVAAQDRRRAGPVGGRQALAPRAEVRRAAADHDPPDRPPAARAGLAGPLVDLAAAPASSRRRRAPCSRRSRSPAARRPRPGSRADRAVEARSSRGRRRARRAQRVEARAPERLVGVDVADPGDERLVEEERLEPAAPAAEPARGRRAA